MNRSLTINVAVHASSYFSTTYIIEYIQNLEHTLCRIPEIGKVVLRRAIKDVSKPGKQPSWMEWGTWLSNLSPQIVCYVYSLPMHQHISRRLLNKTYSIGWLWQQCINQAFHVGPSADYVLFYTVDVVWANKVWTYKPGTTIANDVIKEQTLRHFIATLIDSDAAIDLLIGTFSAYDSDHQIDPAHHPKNIIESRVQARLAHEGFTGLLRPRSEFFLIKKAFFYEFLGLQSLVNKEKHIFDDPTLQFLLYGLVTKKTIAHYDLGGYFVPVTQSPEELERKIAHETDRIAGVIQWAKGL
jgi:hypothetical protein